MALPPHKPMPERVPGRQVQIAERDGDGLSDTVISWTNDPPLELRELFSTPVGVWEGTTIEVIETVDLIFEILSPSIVSIDKNWVGDKTYIGSYRINFGTFEVFVTEGDEGYITHPFFRIIRTTPYFLSSRATASPGLYMQSTSDFCNLNLTSTDDIVGGIDIGSVIVPKTLNAALRTESGISPGFLGKGEVQHKIREIAVMSRPGVSLLRATRTTEISPQALIERPNVLIPTLCGSASTCYDRFLSFLHQTYGSNFISAGDAIAYLNAAPSNDPIVVASPSDLSTSDFVCEGGEVYTYYNFDTIIG